MEELPRHAYQVDRRGPHSYPHPGGRCPMVQFCRPLRRRSLSPYDDVSSSSHVSNSIKTSGCDSPPSVPSTVPEGDANGDEERTEDNSV